NIVDKKAIREKESVHFGFPFNSSFTNTVVDGGYGSIRYLSDQLPGSNLDYLYARRWMDASGGEKGMQMILIEAPLVEPGNMIDERKTINQSHKEWKTSNESTSTWFSYVMNNYWHTNYKADQEGKSEFHYVLQPHGRFDGSNIEKTAFEVCEPLTGFQAKNQIFGSGLFELNNKNIVVTSVTPGDQNSFIIRMFNPGKTIEKVSFKSKTVKQVTLLKSTPGNVMKANELTLPPMAITEVRVAF
ncbi:MAG: hypothetical protein ACXVBJ_15080, partial [Flavisolibacter sp.]